MGPAASVVPPAPSRPVLTASHGRAATSDVFLDFLYLRRPEGIEESGRPSLLVVWWRQRMDEGEAGRDRRFLPRRVAPSPVDLPAARAGRFAPRQSVRAAGEESQSRHGSCRVNHLAKPLER
jgi:hypothetical protein